MLFSFFFLFVVLYVAVPVLTIAGNTLLFQLSTYNSFDYFLIFLLAFFSALLFVLHFYAKAHRAKSCPMPLKGSAVGSSALSGFFASIVGTSACAGCVASFVSFFGLGFSAVSFLLKYQIYISILSLFILLLAIYLTLKKIK